MSVIPLFPIFHTFAKGTVGSFEKKKICINAMKYNDNSVDSNILFLFTWVLTAQCTSTSPGSKRGRLTVALVSLFQENECLFPKFMVDCGLYSTL